MAARLLGASDAMTTEIGFAPFPMYQRARDRLAAFLGERLGPAVCDAARAEGKGMPIEQATAVAEAVLGQAVRTAKAS